MEIQAKVTIRGARSYLGILDDGKKIDSGKIFIDVDQKGENAYGTCTMEYKCIDSKLIDSIKHNPFPFVADVMILQETNGKVLTQLVTAIKPLQQEPKPKAA